MLQSPPSSPLGKIPHLKGARMDGAFCPHAQHIRQGAKKKRGELSETYIDPYSTHSTPQALTALAFNEFGCRLFWHRISSVYCIDRMLVVVLALKVPQHQYAGVNRCPFPQSREVVAVLVTNLNVH